MELIEERWVVIACDSDFIVTEIITIKNMKIDINVNEPASKLVSYYNLPKFLDFTLTLRNEKVIFGDEMGVIDINEGITPMDFGGVEYDNKYIVTVFSNFLGLYEALLKIDNESVNYLRQKLKYFSVSPGNYQKLSGLNNEAVNLQRELYKKNALILMLMKKKEEVIKELEASNATKDRIFSIIGHDLRAPLANIVQSMNLITYDLMEFEEFKQKKIFDHLSESASNTILLLENLLEWSKSQLGESTFTPKDFILMESIRPVINLFKEVALEKKITIIEEININPCVYGDQRIIEVILRNLISNAIKFSNEHGNLIIKVSIENKFAKIVVLDDGLGMSKEKVDTLFDLTTNNVARGTKGESGTGFGLVLCKNLIEQNDGSISIVSKIAEGSEFSFTIPLSKVE